MSVPVLDEQEFRLRCDAALEALYRALTKAAETYEFDADLGAGTVTVEFDDPPAKFVVSPQTPTRQVWVSAHSKSFKLDWDAARGAFILPDSGQTLQELMTEQIGKRLGANLSLGR